MTLATFLFAIAPTLLGQNAREAPTDEILANARNLITAVEKRDQGRTNLTLARSERHAHGRYVKTGKWMGYLSSRVHVIASRDGTIRSFSITPFEDEEKSRTANATPGITREEAIAAAREYWAVLHPGVELGEPYICKRHEVYNGKQGPNWEIQAMPVVGSRPLLYTSDVLMRIDCDRGQLITYVGGATPNLDLAEAPVVPIERGEAANLDAYSRFKPYAHGRIRRTWLAVGAANFAEPNEMTEEHVRLAEANMAIPLYVTHIDDTDTPLAEHPGLLDRYQIVFTDARDGRAIGIVDNFATFGAAADLGPRGPKWRLGAAASVFGTSHPATPLVLGATGRPGDGPTVAALMMQGADLWSVGFDAARKEIEYAGDKSRWRPSQAVVRALLAAPRNRPTFGSKR